VFFWGDNRFARSWDGGFWGCGSHVVGIFGLGGLICSLGFPIILFLDSFSRGQIRVCYPFLDFAVVYIFISITITMLYNYKAFDLPVLLKTPFNNQSSYTVLALA